MVSYIKSDLEFILAQIKIAEAHAAGGVLFDQNDPNSLVDAYTLSQGLRTVDGSYNNLLPGQETWGVADQPFPELLDPEYRPADGTPFDPDGPGPAPAMPTSPNYNPSNNPNALVFDSSLRTISNLIVDQTLGNPAAILTALERAGSADPMADLALVIPIYDAFKPAHDAEYQARVVMQNAKAAADALGDGNPLTPPDVPEQEALDALALATAAHELSVTALQDAREIRDAALEPFGIGMDGDNVHLPNIAPDEGLSAPFNSWFTLFGQFFDHGLDLVNKGGSGTVFVPLQPDDPLYVEGSHTNFMVLTRATVSAGVDGVMGTADDVRPVNTTTPFVDQNQTYTSHPSHQVFLRQYVLNDEGKPVATGHLIEGGGDAPGGMATWGEVKAQAKLILGIDLTDFDVGSVPLVRTDPYGNFIPSASGFPQLIVGLGLDGIPNTADDVVRTYDPDGVIPANPLIQTSADPVSTVGSIKTAHAFLADIAHEAVPVGKIADGDITVGLANPGNGDAEYDNELLDAHFIAGDGRANENIGLTAVHHIFHSEHNRLAEHTKDVILATKDLDFINEWLVDDLTQTEVDNIPTEAVALAAYTDSLNWDGNRLFQAAKFGTEMQYQHLVFEDFARKIQPAIDFFVVPDGYHADINPSIVAEFAHVVYRFGHSMLTETIDRLDDTFTNDQIGLIQAFLNPVEFDAGHTIADSVAAGDIIRGMTRQVGNEIDEFVTSALRDNLLGLPLDLATINLARGRDAGVPSLNSARRDFYEASQNAPELKPYDSWVEFAANLKNEASIINFVAAYGLHETIVNATTIEGKRDAAMTLIFNETLGEILEVPADRDDFLNGTGAWANVNGITTTGLDNIDLWIGGLAEKIMPFGGMLGSTFNFVFEVQLEKLQDGDRFYYLQRLDGLHLLSEMENNTFAKMILKNADAGHLPSDVFSTPGLILEVDRTKQYNPGLGESAGDDGILLDDPMTEVDESADNLGNDPQGGSILTPLVIRNNPATPGPDTNYLKYTGDEHVLLGGTNGNDILVASIGDDTLYGDDGDDRLEGGFGNDQYIGGNGDDIITDLGGDDIIRSGAGNDAIHAGPGTDLVVADDGNDFVVLGTDMLDEVFGGTGNDFILGSKTTEQSMGGEGDDWIEVGAWTGAVGDNFDDQFAADSVIGHDVFHGDGGFDEFIGEGGDDIWVGSLGRGKFDGMSGFDWATYKDMPFGVNADLFRLHFDALPLPPPDAALDEYSFVEGVSGSAFDDEILGSDVTAADMPTEGARGSVLTAEGIALIAGLQAVLGEGVSFFDGGNILLGGDGSDMITGRGGDDIIDGDKWLDVKIGVFTNHDATGALIKSVDSMTELVTEVFNGTINPGQLKIIRSIETANGAGDIDTAVYQAARAEYTFAGNQDLSIQVTHAVVGGAFEDGSDKVRNIEKLQFTDGTLNVIAGTNNSETLNGTAEDDILFGFAGADTLNGNGGDDILVGGVGSTTGSYADNFSSASQGNSDGTVNWGPDWIESGDSGGTTTGQIRIDAGGGGGSNALQFIGGTGGDFNGAQIQRSMDLAGATAATLSYSVAEISLETDDNVTVYFSRTGLEADFVQVDFITDTTGNPGTPRNIDLTLFGSGPFTANAAIRFVASSLETGDSVTIDNLAINFTNPTLNAGVDTLNGGLGNDTYVINFGDGVDISNEIGGIDRISVGGIAPPATPAALTGLNMFETGSDDLAIQFNGQQITINDHFDNINEAVEFINFNGSTFEGYVLEGDYSLSTDDNGDRTATAGVNTALAGTTGGDTLIGNTGNDLVFGHEGGDDLVGGDGDDLLVGGGGDDDLTGGAGIDTLVGGTGNDDYIVEDDEDIIVEYAGGGANDEVQTELAAFSLEFIAEVEDLTYTGLDADPFVGTGNALNNIITGGDLNDVLTGLAGNDTLNGGLGADTMAGGADNDVYFVDDVGDVVNESTPDSSGIDRVESTVSFALGVGVENLDLNGGDAIDGFGNSLANVINGNGADNELFGAGDADILNGGGGADFLDGGSGDDTLDAGSGNDVIIGGGGNDTINLGGGGNDVLVYNANDFGDDVVNGFDANAAGGQDLIDISGLGITLANFSARVFITDIDQPGTDDTLLTIYNAAFAQVGSIYLDSVDFSTISAADFVLSNDLVNLPGGNGGNNVLNGTAGHDLIVAQGGTDTVNGNGGNDVIVGGTGNDTLNGGDGDDSFIWNANAAGLTDGRDVIDGGTEGNAGDTFIINGNGSAETFRIYTREAFDDVAGNNLGGINGATEIIVTRNGTNSASIIAELREIEEIRINALDPAGTEGSSGGDAFQIIGDFSTTSLRPNTIVINGAGDSNTVDVSGMSGANVVFNAAGGSNMVVEKSASAGIAENAAAGAVVFTPTASTIAKGTAAVSHALAGKDAGLFSIDSNTGAVSFRTSPDFEKPGDEGGDNVYDITVVTTTGSLTTERDVSIAVTDVDGAVLKGTKKADVIGPDRSTEEADTILGRKGNDKLFGLDGDDTINGGAGKDKVDGGTGDDLLIGGGGKDTFVFATGYGNDTVQGYKAGLDSFDLSGTGIGSFKALKGMMSESGKAVVIDFGDDTLTIMNTSIKKLAQNQSDFDFA